MVFLVVAIICVVLVVWAPLAVLILWRRAVAIVRVSDKKIVARGLVKSVNIPWADVERIGTLKAPIMVRGLAGALARQIGGREPTQLYFKLANGKSKSFMVSSYENWQQIVQDVQEHVNRPLETMRTGIMSIKWPDVPRAIPTGRP
jgi:hypothetical protein